MKGSSVARTLSRLVDLDCCAGWYAAVSIIAEFLENASRLQQAAEGAVAPKLKEDLLRHAAAYRKLAKKGAKKLSATLPEPPPKSP